MALQNCGRSLGTRDVIYQIHQFSGNTAGSYQSHTKLPSTTTGESSYSPLQLPTTNAKQTFLVGLFTISSPRIDDVILDGMKASHFLVLQHMCRTEQPRPMANGPYRFPRLNHVGCQINKAFVSSPVVRSEATRYNQCIKVLQCHNQTRSKLSIGAIS